MVKIPYIKIPSVRVGSIVPTSNIGTGGATPAPPTPITCLTQWKIVGNSEVHTLPYPDGIILPNGYKRCSYLTSDGTAYIELPFGFNKTDDMYAKVNFNAVYSDERHIISTKTWNVNNDRFCFGVYNSKFAVALGDIATPNGAFTPNAPFNKSVCEVSYSNNQFTLLNEGNTFVCDLDYAVLNSETRHVCLLKNYRNEGTEGAIYEYRHKKGNTEYRLIPCLDSNDTPCMYDVINNQAYYNSAGSGSFTYELYPQPTEIWSCGEYNAVDGKWHILVQPQGGSIADIALDEPLRKVNDVADSIEFPSDNEGKALVTRNVESKTVSAYNDADGNQIATTLQDNTILHIQNLYDYRQRILNNVVFISISQRSAEVKITGTIGANYCGFNMLLQSGKYYTSCFFKNEYAKPNIIYSNSGNSSTVSSSDYQKVSLLKSNVTTLRYSALNTPVGVWQVNDVFFVKDINIFDIDAMFADCTDLKPASASDFKDLFPNLGCIDRTDTAIDVIAKDGKLYKESVSGIEILVPLATPTTELVDAPQIAEADSYSMVISQGAKAIGWSSFETE